MLADSFKAIEAAYKNTDPYALLDLLQALLRFSRDSSLQGSAQRQNVVRPAAERAASERRQLRARQLVEDIGYPRRLGVDPDVAQLCRDSLAEENGAHSWIAADLAAGIDIALGSELLDLYAMKCDCNGGAIKAGEDELVPLVTTFDDAAHERHLTNYANLPSGATELQFSRLLPRYENLDVVYDSTNRRVLDIYPSTGGMAGVKLGVAVLNDASDRFIYDEAVNDGHGVFYNFQPEDEELQLKRMKSVFATACNKGVDIVVFPELCLGHDSHQDFVEFAIQHSKSPRVVAAGSSHRSIDTAYRNTAIAVVKDPSQTTHARLEHDKISPYTFHDGKAQLQEGIAPGAQLTVHIGEDWTYSQLVCRDMLDREISKAIEDLRIGVTTLPAYSRKADVFADTVIGTSASCRGIVIMANNPLQRDVKTHFSAVFGINGMFGGSRPVQLYSSRSPPLLIVFDASRVDECEGEFLAGKRVHPAPDVDVFECQV